MRLVFVAPRGTLELAGCWRTAIIACCFASSSGLTTWRPWPKNHRSVLNRSIGCLLFPHRFLTRFFFNTFLLSVNPQCPRLLRRSASLSLSPLWFVFFFSLRNISLLPTLRNASADQTQSGHTVWPFFTVFHRILQKFRNEKTSGRTAIRLSDPFRNNATLSC